ncbi:MAG: antibiotic biosynthesis monooxygenase [Hyphomonadaceae bacterium]|nr:antibiotic biosynthesis monooxygenase [Hyphomonadaceae bacterium]
MVIVQGTVRVAEADRAKFRAAGAATRQEPGCLLYTYGEDVLDPGLMRISERWRDMAALDAHVKTPHMAAFTAALGGLDLSEVQISAYEVASERVLAG